MVIVMGETTAIAWTDHTFNPWWGCERVSPGCQHCYAETFAKRTGHDVWGKSAGRRFFGDKHWAEPLKWNAAAEAAGAPALVFCSSMADVFEDRPELVEHRARLFDLIEATPHLIWQLLTKRVEKVTSLLPSSWIRLDNYNGHEWTGPQNVWIGTTVEDQIRAERLWWLVSIPAPARFVSCEPLLGPVDLTNIPIPDDGYDWSDYRPRLNALTGHVMGPDDVLPHHVDWVIVGGESGPGHRPFDLNAARMIRDHCSGKVCDLWGVNDRLPVPLFFKQHGGRTPTAGGDVLDGWRIKEFPDFLKRSSRTRVVEVASDAH